ncbi:hypothetical protein CAPTEDRAFT_180119 [Capitella teleta]|uniref:S-adenosyl-L-methionine-dependent tRNA 4-demethylwyosine synthase TYW1 n=1 Tax=Capitella teleta TaxID=283909 RepID=N1PBB7_CAPTE|nr:hypothetical protein CAPTEDRAFT_180119 [Capitella teleta]|eukprot:ELU18799.1 hypothetical protein CAPTEDRAFT_180119 [Capitella teleta]
MEQYIRASIVPVVVIAASTLLWLLFQNKKNGINVKVCLQNLRSVRILILKLFQKSYRSREIKENKLLVEKEKEARLKFPKKIFILFGSQTGKAKGFAEDLESELKAKRLDVQLINLVGFDPEDTLASMANPDAAFVFLLSTYTDGIPPEGAQWFCSWLQASASDFRVSKSLLSEVSFAVAGLGHSLYKLHFCTAARKLDESLSVLGGRRLLAMGELDENVAQSKNGGQEADFNSWKSQLLTALSSFEDLAPVKIKEAECCGECSCQEKKKVRAEVMNFLVNRVVLYESSDDDDDDNEGEDEEAASKLVDVEDLGHVMTKMKVGFLEKDMNIEYNLCINVKTSNECQRTVIDKRFNHSLKRLCRWTKSMLRGRGGCYKHAFYGIASHQCMEATPSLACANKCVFCWRHHTNPVGTEWRWQMDDPEVLINGALQNHTNLIKQFKGVPGVQAERFAEGMAPKHCALSLVGEPIMYPEINRFCELLHSKDISSFLVTNAQFPEAIRNLVPVTQLYVSVDASTKDSLKRIDRPLFRDFWERLIDSLKALSEKGQRTVYRLTLVKSWNTEEIQNYADLVQLGKPDFIEIKGVTYCGESKASTLTMQNVPWHQEVVTFVQMLADLLPDYELASEHEHSNCVLLAHTKFRVDGSWWTWIDYEKFHRLVRDFEESKTPFTAMDYMAPTPSWAVYGAQEQGFDPQEVRHYRKKRKELGGC